jgi:hypothetical protein
LISLVWPKASGAPKAQASAVSATHVRRCMTVSL